MRAELRDHREAEDRGGGRSRPRGGVLVRRRLRLRLRGGRGALVYRGRRPRSEAGLSGAERRGNEKGSIGEGERRGGRRGAATGKVSFSGRGRREGKRRVRPSRVTCWCRSQKSALPPRRVVDRAASARRGSRSYLRRWPPPRRRTTRGWCRRRGRTPRRLRRSGGGGGRFEGAGGGGRQLRSGRGKDGGKINSRPRRSRVFFSLSRRACGARGGKNASGFLPGGRAHLATSRGRRCRTRPRPGVRST